MTRCIYPTPHPLRPTVKFQPWHVTRRSGPLEGSGDRDRWAAGVAPTEAVTACRGVQAGGWLDFILDRSRSAPLPASRSVMTVKSPFGILSIWQCHGSWGGPLIAWDSARRFVDTAHTVSEFSSWTFSPHLGAPCVTAWLFLEGHRSLLFTHLMAQCRAELGTDAGKRGR